MGGMGEALSNAGSAIASGAKSLYGDEKSYLQTGSPVAQAQPGQPQQDPTLAQKLLYGQQPQQGPTAAQRNRQAQASL